MLTKRPGGYDVSCDRESCDKKLWCREKNDQLARESVRRLGWRKRPGTGEILCRDHANPPPSV